MKVFESGDIIVAAHSLADGSSEYVLTKADCLDILGRYSAGELRSNEVRDWAQIMEFSDLVRYEKNSEKIIADLIFALSTPELDARSVEDVAKAYAEKMSRAD